MTGRNDYARFPLAWEPRSRAASGNGGSEGRAILSASASILRRRKTLFLIVMAVGCALLIIALLLQRPKYTATAQIMIERSSTDTAPSPTENGSSAEDTNIETHIAVISSPSILRQVAGELISADKSARSEGDAHTFAVVLRDGLRKAWSALVQPFEVGSRFAEEAPERALARELQSDLRVGRERRSRVISISYTATDPGRAAEAPNRLIALYLKHLEHVEREEADASAAWLSRRIPELQNEVARSEQTAAEYQLTNGLAENAATDDPRRALVQLSRRLAESRSASEATHERLRQLEDLLARDATPEDLAAASGSPAVVAMAKQWEASGAEPMRDRQEATRQARTEIGREIDALKMKATVYDAQTQAIERELKPLEKVAAEAGQSLAVSRTLDRRSAAVAQMYDTLLHRQQEVVEKASVPHIGVRLLSLASPPLRRSSVHPVLIIPPALLALTILAGLIAFARDRLDARIIDDEQAAESLGRACVGALPALKRFDTGYVRDLLSEAPRLAYSREARTLLYSLLPARQTNGANILLVTSPSSSAATSQLSLSLALLAARSGLRVHFIAFGAEGPSPAMIEVAVDGLIASAGDDAGWDMPLRVDRIPASRVVGAVAGVLSSGSNEAHPRGNADVDDLIIIDAPGLDSRPDLSWLAIHAKRILFVLPSGEMTAAAAQKSMRLVENTANAADHAPVVAVSVVA